MESYLTEQKALSQLSSVSKEIDWECIIQDMSSGPQ